MIRNKLKTIIIFYEDVYDNIDNEKILIWKKDKEYKILLETDDFYKCESEKDPTFIEKSIKNMYYVI